MENKIYAEIADMQEICNLLIDKGYRLIKVCPEGDYEVDIADPFLLKEMKAARRRADLARLEASIGNSQLVNALRLWRRTKADEIGRPPFCVLSNKTMLMVALNAPATMDELLAISGFGHILAEKYGAEILDVIADVMEEDTTAQS